jgi:hypothetical protein
VQVLFPESSISTSWTVLAVSSDEAIEMTHRLHKEEGITAGFLRAPPSRQPLSRRPENRAR